MTDERPVAMGSGFVATVGRAWPPEAWSNVTVLVAVSGGADSMAMLRALHALKLASQVAELVRVQEGVTTSEVSRLQLRPQFDGGRLVAAHFNHQTRGDESVADEVLVVETCWQLGLPCEVARAEPGEFERAPDGFEAAARTARQRFLEETALRLGARYVVTAHTADDQAETILHRVIRGTGIAGLAGIPRARALNSLTTLLRPLLEIRRAEVLAYLAEIGQPFREDSSNREARFTRNRVRHELLPQLAQYNPQVVEAILRLGSLAGQAQQVIDEAVARLAGKTVCTTQAGCVTIACRELECTALYLVRELLIAVWRGQGWPEQAMSYDKWNELASMALCEHDSKRMFPGGIRAEQQGGQLRLSLA